MTEPDLFAGGDKSPSISFKNAPVGTTFTGRVTETPKLIQSTDFDSGDPAFWPAKTGETPNPKMSVVINFDVDGEPRSLWAQKPSAMFGALADAQKAAGCRIDIGCELSVKFTGEKAHTDPVKIKKGMPAQKLYAAKLTAAPTADPFATTPAAEPTASTAGTVEPPW